MAINMSEFTQDIKRGLKANNTFTKFFYRFKVDGKSYRKQFNYENQSWDKRTRIQKAEREADEYRESKINPRTQLNENIKLNDFIAMHFDKLPNTTWRTTKINHYNNYIKNMIGNKKIISINQMDIKEVIKAQEQKGLAPRTVKTTLELLNPCFKEAMANRLIDYNPCFGINVKLPKTKKLVLSPSEKFNQAKNAIYHVFHDNPFYLSLYLFALLGRRKSEVLKLKWEHIDFNNDTYLLIDTKNGEHQLFNLPEPIKNELEKFRESSGWIYESSVKRGQRIENIEKQTNKLKAIMPELTLHYLRNILVSAMAEQGLSATLMSGALGHNNTNTLSKYLSIPHLQGSQEANKMLNNVKE